MGGLRGQTGGRERERGADRGVRGRLPGRGTGGLLGGVAPPRLRKRGVPGLGETETTPSVPEPGQGCTGRRTLAAREGGRRAERGGPAASAAPSPGVSARDNLSPGSGRCYSRRRQAVTSPELRRETQPPPVGGGRGQWRGSSAAGPGNRLRLQRCSGTDTDPRGRHDGLGAAPQRGQTPPLTPPPATSGARLAGTRALPAPLSGTPPRPLPLVSLPAGTWPRTTF